MEVISISSVVTSLMITAVTAVATFFCTPLFSTFKSSVEAMRDPRSLDNDLTELDKLLTEIKAMGDSEEIDRWIGDANVLMKQRRKLWQPQSGCLCSNGACFRCSFSRKLKDMIFQGEMVKRLTITTETVLLADVPTQMPEPVQFRCLSCFSFFIPTGNGFKLFKIYASCRDDFQLCDAEPNTVEYILNVRRESVEEICDVRQETQELICDVRKETQELVCDAQGETVELICAVEPETVEHIHDIVPNVEDGTTAERTLKKVMDALNDNDAWCIGLWGPEGVGKSTLVKGLYTKKSDSPFSLVRLIELKANDEQSNIGHAIAKSLKMNMRDGIEDQIRNRLQKEKFLLILDNVWSESICLSSIGIPERQEGCKILLTTRFQRVCTKMGAKAIEMGCLTRVEAWQLFAEKAGEVVNDEKIKPLAEEVCDGCGYLPLAIVVAGSAMKGETNSDEWQTAVNKLQSYAAIDVDIGSNVDNPLKFSYDSLDDTLKACFLYCSLYPEGCYIEIYELVQCWLAENLINVGSYYIEAYKKGLALIKKLKELCLLEQGVDEDDLESQTVKMHDMVRDFARRIGMSMNKSVIFSRHGITRNPFVKLPREIQNCRWIALVDNSAIILPKQQTDNSSVTTILLRGTDTEENFQVPMEFLNGFRAVKVLNIEGVNPFAASLLQLKELHTLILRNCSNIEELPTENNLKVLVLSHSHIRKVPRGMKKLSNVKELDLSYTPNLESIHGHVIRNLTFLEVVNMCGSRYTWSVKKRSGSEEATLQDLSGLLWLKEVYLQLAEVDGTYEEFIWMERLQHFFLAYNHPAKRKNEGKVFVINVDGKSVEVGSFILHADSLILHHIVNVNEIFADFSSSDQSNSKLKSLEICKSGFDLSSTATIPDWLSLEILQVRDCPNLKKLPFMPSIKEIRGSIKWWETVEWDSEETKSFMEERFKPID